MASPFKKKETAIYNMGAADFERMGYLFWQADQYWIELRLQPMQALHFLETMKSIARPMLPLADSNYRKKIQGKIKTLREKLKDELGLLAETSNAEEDESDRMQTLNPKIFGELDRLYDDIFDLRHDLHLDVPSTREFTRSQRAKRTVE